MGTSMSRGGRRRGLTLFDLLLLVIALLGIWSLAMGEPVWEWVR